MLLFQLGRCILSQNFDGEIVRYRLLQLSEESLVLVKLVIRAIVLPTYLTVCSYSVCKYSWA